MFDLGVYVSGLIAIIVGYLALSIPLRKERNDLDISNATSKTSKEEKQKKNINKTIRLVNISFALISIIITFLYFYYDIKNIFISVIFPIFQNFINELSPNIIRIILMLIVILVFLFLYIGICKYRKRSKKRLEKASRERQRINGQIRMMYGEEPSQNRRMLADEILLKRSLDKELGVDVEKSNNNTSLKDYVELGKYD